MESRGPNRSLQERLVDERALFWTQLPVEVMTQILTRDEIHRAISPRIPPRFGYETVALTAKEVFAIGVPNKITSDFQGYSGTGRPAIHSV